MTNDSLISSFEQLWSDLFTSPVHLDSALSKRPKYTKSILARIVPAMLLRLVPLAEAYGIGVPEGEPWNLSPAKLAQWRPARLLAERLIESIQSGAAKPIADVAPVEADFPPHMIAEWKERWGKETAARLIAELGKPAPLSLRVSRKLQPAAVVKELSSIVPVRPEVSEWAPLAVRLGDYAPVLHTDLYERGAYEIQDEGSQWMALYALWPEIYSDLLQDNPSSIAPIKEAPALPRSPDNLSLVDACAGAGGKSLALADFVSGKGRIFSYDTSERKLQALRRRASHAGYRNIQAVALEEGSEEKTIARFEGSADVVLVDAPCSGWGVLRRNPDIKWRQGLDVLKRMPEIQARLLSLYSKLVAPGGRLVFGVCTFRYDETKKIVDDFEAHHPEFKPLKGGYLGPGTSDGFFMQAFSRGRP